MLTRLARVKMVMIQLANNNTTLEVPSITDKDEIGDVARTVAVFRSNAIALSEHKSQLERLNQHFDIALGHMSQGLCLFDGEQRVVICNERYLTMYGLTTDQVKPGTTLRQIVQYRLDNGICAEGGADAYMTERTAPVVDASDKVQQLSDGRYIAISRRPMLGGGWVTTHQDVSAQHRAAERIAHMAKHDAFDRPGPIAFTCHEQLDVALAGVRRGDRLAVHCLDLDGFKAVNDTFGHPVGDILLQAVADRLRGCVRELDIVARLGGDEFAVIQTRVEQPQQVAVLAGRLINAIRAPFEVGASRIEIGTSVGIALAPGDGNDAIDLLKRADMALYRAKAEGRGTFSLYESAMEELLSTRRTLERELRQVLESGSLELHYQPILDLQTGLASGFEALLRWRHSERGFIPPLEFISVAE
ncbi:MAG: diguanylate cyclase [Rhodospirillales bacterium]|nr:diguanylate cyclase [Rhodospirillales bacterium]